MMMTMMVLLILSDWPKCSFDMNRFLRAKRKTTVYIIFGRCVLQEYDIIKQQSRYDMKCYENEKCVWWW